MSKGFFITGTDTDVGKTVVAGAIIRMLQGFGLKPCGFKPIESGCSKEGNVLIPSDGTFLKHVSSLDEQIDELTVYCFESQLSPLMAGEREGVAIDPIKIAERYRELKKKYDVFVVEGVGGLLVPLTADYFVLDMAGDFGLPLLIVTRPGLGTLNHTLLTVRYALREGIEVAGVIVDYSRPSEGTLAEQTNVHALNMLLPVPVIGQLGYLKDLDYTTIETNAMNHFDVGLIRKYVM